MIHIIAEGGNKELKNRRFVIGDRLKKHLTDTLNGYQGDRTVDGYKRLNNILNMEDGIEYNEMKRLKNFFDNYNGTKKSAEYILNGGDAMKFWVDETLNNATQTVRDFKQAKKDAGIDNAFIRSHEKNRQTGVKKPRHPKMKTKNVGKNMMDNKSIQFEGVIREENERILEYMEDYDIYYIINDFMSDPNGVIDWGVLINPSEYQKALSEYTQFGYISRFPSNRIYQWFGIIMRNTCILEAASEIAGHTSINPHYDIIDCLGEDFIADKLHADSIVNIDYNKDIITYTDDKGEDKQIRIDIFYDNIGLYDFLKLPDGSDAWSDYGLGPLWKIINEYHNNMSPEETLVLVNRALDVAHCRGDLPSAFIEGGSKSLSDISNLSVRTENRHHTVIITEEQSKMLKEIGIFS